MLLMQVITVQHISRTASVVALGIKGIQAAFLTRAVKYRTLEQNHVEMQRAPVHRIYTLFHAFSTQIFLERHFVCLLCS